jgi:hypothetical protein
MTSIEKELKSIKERNRRVEIDKMWETSFARKSLIALLTYVTISTFFVFARVENPFFNAIVPTLGFLLSTLTLNFFKKIWVRNMLKSYDIKSRNNER